MKMMKICLILCFICFLLNKQQVQAKLVPKQILQDILAQVEEQDDSQYDYSSVVEQIKYMVEDDQSHLHGAAYERLAYVVDTYGPRLWGSQQLELVIDELAKMAKEVGFDSVVKEPVTDFTKWVRGNESLTLYDPRPFPQKLKMIGLGRSVSGDIKTEVVVVISFEDLELKSHLVKGKIVCFAVEWVDYDTTVAYRSQGAIKAAEFGAVGVLVRSVTPFSIDSPHTGAMSYKSGVKQIPAAAISVEDSHMLKRMYNRGQKIVVHLQMENQSVPNSSSFNLIADIKGSEYPDEIVIFGGHIDSWDTGSQTGANDDGGGVITCFEALRTIKLLNLQPKRTMRFIAWSGEEYGGADSGASQYARDHKDEMKNHVLGFESDLGSLTPYGFGFSGNPADSKIMTQIIEQSFGSMNCTQVFLEDHGVMVDTGYLYELGVPAMRQINHDVSDKDQYYFTFHHSAGDSMDIMHPEMMDQNVIVIASMMYIVADMDQRLTPN